MTLTEEIITIALCSAATVVTRFAAFVTFSAKRPTPPVVLYLGKALPLATFAMLVVYCLRHVEPLQGNHGLPQLLAIAVTIGLHVWKRCMLLSMAGGTLAYMLMVQSGM